MSTANPARKVELQSPSDLTHLISVAQEASSTKLSEAFPMSASRESEGPDGMRAQVAALLDQFLDETYTGVRQNILLNGVPADSTSGEMEGGEENFEAFDAKLAEKIRALEEKKELLTERIAELRRDGPSKAATKYRGEWEAQTQVMDVDEKTQTKPEVEPVPEMMDVDKLPRWDEVQKTYGRALDGVLALKTGMSGTVGSLEEARRVGESLQSK